MDKISVAHTKAHLSQVLARVEAGQEVVVTRRGHPVARITPFDQTKRAINLEKVDAFRERMPATKVSSAEIIRRLRDERY
jgi:prevent-host-death family protein